MLTKNLTTPGKIVIVGDKIRTGLPTYGPHDPGDACMTENGLMIMTDFYLDSVCEYAQPGDELRIVKKPTRNKAGISSVTVEYLKTGFVGFVYWNFLRLSCNHKD